jgi:(E)-4-hydroxy-3-methylbut-2-enyl-diphosphate synthase
MNDMGSDYVYTGNTPIPFMLPNGLKEIIDYATWVETDDHINKYPLLDVDTFEKYPEKHAALNFLRLMLDDLTPGLLAQIQADKTLVLLLDTNNTHAMAEQRRFFYELLLRKVEVPVVILRKYEDLEEEKLMLYGATDMGGLLIDGFGDGVMFSNELIPAKEKEAQLSLIQKNNSIAFGILQAARTRISKTEYISCPSCGRTLFDLQETTAMIRHRTDHLKGVKIGIMGCIVNGPGEMADADYGYVGSGKGKITLYRGKEVVKRSVPSAKAVDELINLIREDGKWIEPEKV